MSLRRRSILTAQAILTALFLGAAVFTFFGNPLSTDSLRVVETLPLGEAPQALRLTVHDTGIAAITMRDLRGAELPFDELSPENVNLTRDGDPVSIYVDGEGNDATLYFYARAITNTLEMPAVYWLSPGQGKTMSQRDRSPTMPGVSQGTMWRHWEENSTFHAFATGDDTWFGANVYAPDSLEMMLTGIQATGGPGILTVRVWSNNQSPANPDHHLRVLLNGIELADHFWDGISQEEITIPLNTGVLQRQGNRLILDVPGDTGAAGESIYLDWVNLEYQGDLSLSRGQLRFRSSASNISALAAVENVLAFDVSDPEEPVLLMNIAVEDNTVSFAGSGPRSEYLVLNPRDAIRPEISAVPDWPDPLRDPDRGADYIAIVPEVAGFSDALVPLLEHRRNQGLRTTAVPLQQIYDEFGHGRQTPQAIRDFLSYAYNQWRRPRPQFVLLVGDASYDINNFVASRNQNLLSTKLVFTQYAGYVSSDAWYTIFDETGVPAMAIGRFPAQNSRQLRVMVDKTVAYESNTPSQWQSRVLLVADDEPRFDTASDWLADELDRRGYITQKLYMTQNEDIHDAIISVMNHGVGVVNYVGHGGIDVWGDEAVLQNEDAVVLRNSSRLPLFTTFTCLNGVFNHPELDALAETLLWTRGGGIAAAVAPSGRTYSAQQTPLATAFYSQLLGSGSSTVGEALLHAKQTLAQESDPGGVIHTFNVLGDPALRFQAPTLSRQ